jgi:hypothetical protein
MDQDLEALRRRAYSREGTDEDHRRLAAAARLSTPREEAAAAEPVVRTPPIAVAEPSAVAVPDPVAPTRRRRRRWPVVVSALAGLAVGLGAGLLGSHLTPGPTAYDVSSSLRVFDVPAQAPPEGAVIPEAPPFRGDPLAEIRYLGEVDRIQVYASRLLTSDGEAIICLAATAPDGLQNMTCGGERDFRRLGLSVPTSRGEILWGPTGGVRAD